MISDRFFLLLLTAGTAFAGPRIEVHLNNNPACATKIESLLKKETWDFANTASLTVSGSGLADGKQEVVISIRSEMIAKRQLRDRLFRALRCIEAAQKGVEPVVSRQKANVVVDHSLIANVWRQTVLSGYIGAWDEVERKLLDRWPRRSEMARSDAA